jgi:hypothetical protein
LSRLILYCAYCYYNDMFYIHFGGSLEYWINEYVYEYEYKIVIDNFQIQQLGKGDDF